MSGRKEMHDILAALYALGMMNSSAHLAVYEKDKVKKQRFLDRVDYHTETIKKYLEESK